MRRANPRGGPPQRSSPSASRGVRGAASTQPIRTSRALERDDRAGRERLARFGPRQLRLDPFALVERPGQRRAPAGPPRAGQLQHARSLRRSAAAGGARCGSDGLRSAPEAPASSAASERAVDHMIFELAGVVLADRPAARRLPRLVNRLAAAGDQIMPVAQRLARGAQAGRRRSRAASRARSSCLRSSFTQSATQLLAMLVIEAAAVAPVEQLARDVGRIEQAGFLVLELVDAAAPAAVAQRFPLAAVERRRAVFPKMACGRS